MRRVRWRNAWMISALLVTLYATIAPLDGSRGSDQESPPAWAIAAVLIGLQVVIAGVIYAVLDARAERRLPNANTDQPNAPMR